MKDCGFFLKFFPIFSIILILFFLNLIQYFRVQIILFISTELPVKKTAQTTNPGSLIDIPLTLRAPKSYRINLQLKANTRSYVVSSIQLITNFIFC